MSRLVGRWISKERQGWKCEWVWQAGRGEGTERGENAVSFIEAYNSRKCRYTIQQQITIVTIRRITLPHRSYDN